MFSSIVVFHGIMTTHKHENQKNNKNIAENQKNNTCTKSTKLDSVETIVEYYIFGQL